jgi:tetratricopeptide (TPR) repeat protein
MSEETSEEELVGRTDELASMVVAMRKGPCVLHVIGPAGAGKSSLAIEAAKRNGGARLLRLGDARDASGVSSALAGRGFSGSLEAWILEQKPGIVVLDAIDDVADLVKKTLDTLIAGGLTAPILLTSSARLDLPGERVIVAAPLPPDAARLLFARRLAQAREGAVVADDADGVDAVLGALEGLPLAVVAAAERMAVLDARDLAKRLEAHGRSVLAGTELEASVRRAIQGLPKHLGEALRQIVVFEGPFTVEEAEGVLALDGAVVEALHDLRKRWLLVAVPREQAMLLRTTRTVRGFVLDDVTADSKGPFVEVRARHARYFGERAKRHLSEKGPLGGRDELPDLLAAAITFHEAHDVESALSVLACIEPQDPTVLASEVGRALLDSLVDAAVSTLKPSIEGRALLLRGRISQYVGRTDLALVDVEAALERARKAKDALLEGLVLQRLGSLRADTGDAAQAVTLLTRAVSLLETRSWRGTVYSLSTLGTAEMACGDTTSARGRFLDALALRESHGDTTGTGQEHAGIGATLFQEGRLDEAVRSFDRARDLLSRAGSRDILGYALAARAMTLQELGRFSDAESDLLRALDEFKSAKNRRFWRVFSGYLAQAQHEAGVADRAEGSYREAIRALRTDGHLAYEGLFTASLAALLASVGRLDEAESLLHDETLRADVAPQKDPRALAVAIHAGHLFVAKAKAARDAGGDMAPHVARARARLALAATARTDDDVRFAERMLAKAISSLETSSTQESLHVGKDTSSFRLGPRAEVDLRRKRATRLMMRALVEERLRAPGEPMSVDTLVKATWPGERILPHAALSRAYVTVLMLRNLGLRTVLLQRDGGYFLDPEIPLVTE